MAKEPRRIPNTTCDLCEKPIYRRRSTLQRNKGKYCSRACRNKVYPPKRSERAYSFPKGQENPAWKGGVTYFKKKGNYTGVRYVRCPQEYLAMARKDGYIMEHRLVMAIHMGRLLTKMEVVHHENHNPGDNRIENLVLFANNSEHKRYEHMVGAVR